jgi:hypothetical protein
VMQWVGCTSTVLPRPELYKTITFISKTIDLSLLLPATSRLPSADVASWLSR